MSEKTYRPIIQSGAYTIEWAERRGVTPATLDPTELISDDATVREESGAVVSGLIEEYLKICGPDGRVSLPTYPVKRLLPENPSKYKEVVAALHARYMEAVERCYGTKKPEALVRLFSVGFGPDGYRPTPGETVESISEHVRPQISAAKEFGYRPIVEATTTRDRFTSAWRAANDALVKEIDIGLAFDSHGHLAGDGTTLAELIEYVRENPEKLTTKVVLGANCGSLTGIEKAATKHPGTLRFAYANSIDIEDMDHLTDIENGTVHHHREPVTVEEFARIAEKHGFEVISLCCGFGPDCVCKLSKVFRAD
jgi:sugar phosphate isomerase/epimerase